MQILKVKMQYYKKYKVGFFSLPAAALILILCTKMLFAQAQVSREHQVKAVFLFNFAQFVQWPEHAFLNDHAPLIIGVLGTDPFGDFLDETVKGEEMNGHPLQVHRYQKPEDLTTCHILFIGSQKGEHMSDVLEKLKDKHVLTVGETSGFIKQGGMIRFITEQSKIRFQINLTVTKEADLTISSKLLRVAEIVTP